jgi:oxygen-independent coproporphyrinogen III oxidase
MAEFLYIHIPYCARKCDYCDFFSLPFNGQASERYVESLCREMAIRKTDAGRLKSIYIGGGTPTLLPDKAFKDLFEALRSNFDFSPDIEISVEANPGTVNAEKVKNLISVGINRVSLGIQSFHDRELKSLGRIHSSDEALRAVELLKSSGLANFSLDLMYGIPGQTLETWKETLSLAAGLLPRHISSYELTPEEGTPFFLSVANRILRMPEEELILDMYGQAIDFLRNERYEHYEISNFALPGSRCRHNLNYWERGDYIGAGAGSHSFLNGVRSQNIADVDAYIKKLSENIIPEVGTIRLTEDESLKELIFLGLRKTEGFDPADAIKARPDFISACAELMENGYLENASGSLRLTRKGLPVSNMVIVQLFERLGL